MTTITQERSALAKVGMTLRRREQWGARRSYTDARTVHEPATRVFVHITVTNPSNYNSRDAHARAIESIGISRFSATGISYNRLIFAGTDTVYEAQPIGRRGAHTVNDHKRSTCTRWGSACPGYKASLTAPSWNLNYNARAYVICQNVQHTVTDQMVTALARAIAADARAGFVTEYAAQRPHGHRCVSSKSCPGDRMWAQMGRLDVKIGAFLANPATIGVGGGTTIPDPTVPGGFDPEEDDVRPSDWNADDRAAVREALFGENHFLNNVIVKSSETLPGAGGKEKNWAWVLRRIVALLDAPFEMPDGRLTNPRTAWKWAREDAARAVALLLAQEPLLEAAAQGRSLSASEVQQIAGAVSAVIPANLVEELADELGSRLVAGGTGPDDE